MFPEGVHRLGGANAAPGHARRAKEFYKPIIPLVLELHKQGKSLREIGADLEMRGIATRLGYGDNRWSAAQVRRVLLRGLGKSVEVKPPKPASPSLVEPAMPELTSVNNLGIADVRAAIDAGKVANGSVKAAAPQQEAACIRLVLHGKPTVEVLTKSQVLALLDAGKITPETRYFLPGMLAFMPVRTLFESTTKAAT